MKPVINDRVLSDAEALVDDGQYESAITLLESHDFANEAEACLLIAYANYKLERYEAAIQCFDDIEIKYGSLQNSTYLRANCHLEIGHYSLAEKDFEKVISINPEIFDAFVGLGVVKESQGRPDEAVKYYLSALRLNPGSTVAKSRLNAISNNS